MTFRRDLGDGVTSGNGNDYAPHHKDLNDQMTPEERALFEISMQNPTDPKAAPGSLAVDAMNDGIEDITTADALEREAGELFDANKDILG